ncbi:MAG: ferritin [Ignisphaera sp.]
MLSGEVLEALNRQLNQELQNAYLYLSIASYFDELSLSGFAHYFKVQAREELEHAMKIYSYIIDRGGRVELFEVPKPKSGWGSILEAIEEFYRAETENTKKIWNLVELARSKGDKATESFLKWFIDEQVEEEKNAADLLAKVKLVKDSPAALLALDNMLAQRK